MQISWLPCIFQMLSHYHHHFLKIYNFDSIVCILQLARKIIPASLKVNSFCVNGHQAVFANQANLISRKKTYWIIILWKLISMKFKNSLNETPRRGQFKIHLLTWIATSGGDSTPRMRGVRLLCMSSLCQNSDEISF